MLICIGVIIFLILLSCGVEFYFEDCIACRRNEIIYTVFQSAIAFAFFLWLIIMLLDMFVDII